MQIQNGGMDCVSFSIMGVPTRNLWQCPYNFPPVESVKTKICDLLIKGKEG